eukprot:TRINITY_DN1257_c0_g1_i6.p1 TRINITY_DN1257_c0_g1~~TRINITY_DN1257_c0_g1_i6.p1  ORF type:complete len:862 (+),score=234.41 TRINITY_DN1257_c0_g1_i6:286-2871(+)
MCSYPQEVQVRFEQRVHLSQLQLLSHEYKIATRVELFILDSAVGNNWTRLGHFSLNENEASRQQARELKSVQLTGNCTHMMLRILDCHQNQMNTHSQVGIVALSVFGQPEELPRAPSRAAGGALDMLAQDLNVDRESARKIRDLTARKEAAVAAEDYDLAKQCKLEIQALQKVVSQISQLERRKQAAVDAEDYDTAKQLKQEIDKIRAIPTIPDPVTNLPQHTIPPAVPPPSFPQQFEYPSEATDNLEPSHDPSHYSPRDTSRASGHTEDKWHQQPADASQPAYETYAEASELPPSPSRNRMPAEFRPTESTDMEEEDMSNPHPNPHPNTEPTDMEQEIPRFGIGQPEVEEWETAEPAVARPETRELNIGRGGAHMYSPESEVPTEQPQPSHAELPDPEPLSGPDKTKAEHIIPVFGEYVAKCVFSKDRNLREHAQGLVLEELSSVVPSEVHDTLRSSSVVLSAALHDKMQTVLLKAFPVLERSISIAAGANLNSAELSKSLGILADILVERISDSNKRVAESSQDGLEMLARFGPTRPSVCSGLCKPLKNKKAWPQLASRIMALAKVTPLVGVGELAGTLDLETVMELIVSGFVSPNDRCRDAALKATLEIAHEVGDNDMVVSYLKDDLKPQQLEMLEKSLPTNMMHSGKPAPPPVEVQKPVVRRSSADRGSVQNSPVLPRSNKSVLHSPRDDAERAQMNKSLLGGSLKRHSVMTQQASKLDVQEDDEDEFDDDFPSDMCQFCGLQDPNFTEDTLDYHFWQDCPMLCSCPECQQVIEIMCLSEHLLSECEARDNYTECTSCQEPLKKSDEPGHKCGTPTPQVHQNRCPLCHANFTGGEDGWREHLLVPPGCSANSRALLQ